MTDSIQLPAPFFVRGTKFGIPCYINTDVMDIMW